MRRYAKRIGLTFLVRVLLMQRRRRRTRGGPAHEHRRIIPADPRPARSDKTDGVKPAAAAIVKQAETMGSGGAAIAKAAATVAAASDFKTAREAFGPLSDAVIARGRECPRTGKASGPEAGVLPDGESIVAAEGRQDPESVLRLGDARMRRASRNSARFRGRAVHIASGAENGPGARQRERPGQPTRAAAAGSSRMLTIVSRNPAQICSVSAVPT